MTTIAVGTTQTTGYVASIDNSGNLVFQTNGTTTAMTLDTSQNANIVGRVTAASANIIGNATVSGNLSLTGTFTSGNTTTNTTISNTNISIVGDSYSPGLVTAASSSVRVRAVGTNASYVLSAISNNSVEAFFGADTTNRAIFGAYSNHGVELRANNDPKVIAYASGIVTHPYQTMVSAELSTNQTLIHQAVTRIDFDTITSSTASGTSAYSTTNKRFTAPITGTYLVCFHIYVYSTDQVEGYIYKNGSSYIRVASRTANLNTNPNGIVGSHILRLTAGDYLEIWCYHSRYNDTAAATVYMGGGNRPSHVSYALLG